VAVEDTTFWVVRPRIGVGGVSGLGTLLSGAYIGVDAGISGNSRTEFIGLEAAPYILRGEPGASFVLRAADLGSLDVGSPVYYKRTRVGRVVGYTLDPARDELLVKIFVEAPYEKLVTPQTRFWNASGVDLSLSAGGLTLNTQTLTSVLAGGIAFAQPADAPKSPAAASGSQFQLFNNRKAALAPLDGPALPVRMVFEQSLRGLNPGAAVDFLGVEIGNVSAVALQ
jgi:paraquat-inducible protein B